MSRRHAGSRSGLPQCRTVQQACTHALPERTTARRHVIPDRTRRSSAGAPAYQGPAAAVRQRLRAARRQHLRRGRVRVPLHAVLLRDVAQRGQLVLRRRRLQRQAPAPAPRTQVQRPLRPEAANTVARHARPKELPLLRRCSTSCVYHTLWEIASTPMSSGNQIIALSQGAGCCTGHGRSSTLSLQPGRTLGAPGAPDHVLVHIPLEAADIRAGLLYELLAVLGRQLRADRQQLREVLLSSVSASRTRLPYRQRGLSAVETGAGASHLASLIDLLQVSYRATTSKQAPRLCAGQPLLRSARRSRAGAK
jgi:hypothetical protein